MEILAIGDVHLGRQPARSSPVLQAVDADAFGPRAAWQRCVAYALERCVEAVVLTGDLVEHPRDYYAAYVDLEAGVGELRDAGIPVVAVAGNHDFAVLPHLADSIVGVELLGRGGQWSSTRIDTADGPVEFVGWSFTRQQAPSPLRQASDLPERDPAAIARLGVLHCDVDSTSATYAPVQSATLERADVDGWLLGHIHKPDDLAARGPRGYLGSVVGLDPSERGPHGPWLLTVRPGPRLTMAHVVLAPLRWEARAIDVSDLSDAHQVHDRIVSDMRALDEAIDAEAYQAPVAVGRRLHFAGVTPLRAELEEVLADAELAVQVMDYGGKTYFVDAYWFEVQPPIDLEVWAQHKDPAGLLAARVLLLDGPDCDEKRALIEGAQRELAALASDPRLAKLGEAPPDAGETRRFLREAALEALYELVGETSAS